MFLAIKYSMHHQSSPTSLKYYDNKIIKWDLLESYFLDRFAQDITLSDLYIIKDECMSSRHDDVIASR